jgi:hypothetical protein
LKEKKTIEGYQIKESKRAEIHNKLMEIFQSLSLYAKGKGEAALKILFDRARFSEAISDYLSSEK